ncbi:hypothetical protein AMTRI_Chr04g187080 [Amborella trichopoda]
MSEANRSMGIIDNSFSDLIERVTDWIPWSSDLYSVSREFSMPNEDYMNCSELEGMRISPEDAERIRACNFCSQSLDYAEKHHPMASGQNNLPPLVSLDGDNFDSSSANCGSDENLVFGQSGSSSGGSDENLVFGRNGSGQKIVDASSVDGFDRFLEGKCDSPQSGLGSSVISASNRLSRLSIGCRSSRSDWDEECYFKDGEATKKSHLSPSNECCQEFSDIDGESTFVRHELYNFKSGASSPWNSPTIISSPDGAESSVKNDQGGTARSQNDALMERDMFRRSETETEDLDDCTDASPVYRHESQKEGHQPLDFENNGLIWFPPPPEDEGDEVESSIFEYDDEDDDDVGDMGLRFSSSSFSGNTFRTKEKPSEELQEPLRAVVHGHYRALVAQLLRGDGIFVGNEDDKESWLEILTALAWQAANFVKPDTKRGGSMDPGGYVKIKCIACGKPSESTFIKGVVCTKNIKHKRMTSQYKNPRLLLLGGALEYQRVANQLASFDALLQQEIDHLKMVVAKIEAHRPNVLLVEKSVSHYAQEFLLAKEISLVLNVKRPLLERIARCSGAQIVPSIDNLTSPKLGQCENFRLERFVEEDRVAGQPTKRSSKTLMFFERCPRRLGCTVLLRGGSQEELKKVKKVLQYAVFAAYHLSLETSFLADEGATIPKLPFQSPIAIPEKLSNIDKSVSYVLSSATPFVCEAVMGKYEVLSGHTDLVMSHPESPVCHSAQVERSPSPNFDFDGNESGSELVHSGPLCTSPKVLDFARVHPCDIPNDADIGSSHDDLEGSLLDQEISTEYFPTSRNTHQSILVSLSSRCVLKGTVCERSQLFRIKFYGSFDKPLGRYLRDDLFDQSSCCRSCNEPADAHIRCYTHQQGSLTICVKHLPSLKLPGERDGKIWMWHRCLKCAHKDGVPQATRRVVMSDAAWGLSFGKFLELSFSNHAAANRIASCGHSLQRDCLRFYGFGSMVAFFRYSPIDILSVHLPPSVLEFNSVVRQDWAKKEAAEVIDKIEFLYEEVSDALDGMEKEFAAFESGYESTKVMEFYNYIDELKDLLIKERGEYMAFLYKGAVEICKTMQPVPEVLELNHLRRCLLIDSYMWDRRICLLHSLSVKSKSGSASSLDGNTSETRLKDTVETEVPCRDNKPGISSEVSSPKISNALEKPKDNLLLPKPSEEMKDLINTVGSLPTSRDTMGTVDLKGPSYCSTQIAILDSNSSPTGTLEGKGIVVNTTLEPLSSFASNLSDKIDLAWTGEGQIVTQGASNGHGTGPATLGPTVGKDQISQRKILSPVRVYSFDSALKFHPRSKKGPLHSALHLSSTRSFHSSGDFRSLVWEPIPKILKSFSRASPGSLEAFHKFDFLFSYSPSVISSISRIVTDGARLLLPATSRKDVVIAVYDGEPTSVIAYALCTKEYENQLSDKLDEIESSKESHIGTHSSFGSVWHSDTSLDTDFVHPRSYGSEEISSLKGSPVSDMGKSPLHVKVTFGDDSSLPSGKARFLVTCYFARQFDALRRKCCDNEMDFLRSLSRNKRWSAQGGKSNVYFAKTLDERFVIKQVTKTELESFEEFAPEYFKYLSDAISTGSPTCLAKILGIYQVTVKNLKGGKESRMDLMVMENLFYGRNVSRVYDLKGSARSRYNPETGSGNVLLDQNLLEVLRTKPIFLGSKAKRNLERAVWNDTSFLTSVDVMDYSLLVGVDEESKELVMGIIDFMRQYTWDKHFETWVKASGILGGPKNAAPTVVSPEQYKKRFRKAMSTYFRMVPDQWSP